jgi:hypothetical protein
MTQFTALVAFENGGGSIWQVDVIEHEGGFWLVPEWFEFPELGTRKPVRIISLKTIRHQDQDGGPFPRFVLNAPISKDVFDGVPTPKAVQYVVIEQPDISRPLPERMN